VKPYRHLEGVGVPVPGIGEGGTVPSIGASVPEGEEDAVAGDGVPVPIEGAGVRYCRSVCRW